jgi:predicted DNA-binding ribbon-helix-helix protein
MPLIDEEDLSVKAEQRARFRLNHVGTKLNDAEVKDLESLAKRRNLTQGELIRQLILDEINRDSREESVSTELTEIVAVRLLITNLLKPFLLGKTLTPEAIETIFAEVTSRKRSVALKAQKES